MSDSTPTLERVALAVGDKLGGFDGAGELYRNNGDVRWKQSLEIARAALDASGNDELIEALTRIAGLTDEQIEDGWEPRNMAHNALASIARTQEQSDG